MKRLFSPIFLVMAVMALGMSCAFPAHAAEGEAAPKEKPAKSEGGDEGEKKKGAADVSGGRFAGDPVYVHITPMIMPVITDQGVEQLVTVIIDVEVKDFDTADMMHTKMPKIKDALMGALYGGLGQGTLRDGKIADVKKIKAKATAALTDVVGDGIKEVLIQGISQRML
jgi:flagellar FliL protein